jgi:putative hydrolase of the HAD superfamily
MLRLALFDLDDTLYPASCGLWPVLVMRIEQYMIERLGIAAQSVPEMRRRYVVSFGSTLNGLRREYNIDTLEYLAFVHDVPLDQFIQPQPALSEMLGRLPLEKVIFTNADAPHARRVLARLGIAEHFPLIVDVGRMDFYNKPDPRAYQLVLALTGARPDECIFVDDRLTNLQPARELGMTTVLVTDGAAGTPAPGIDFQISSILEIEPIITAATGVGVLLIQPGTSQLNAPTPAATAEGGVG